MNETPVNVCILNGKIDVWCLYDNVIRLIYKETIEELLTDF